MTVASDEMRAEAREAMTKVRRELDELTNRRTALLMHYLNHDVPMTDIADGLSTKDRTYLYKIARDNGWQGARPQDVDLNGYQVHPSTRRTYDALVAQADGDGVVEITIAQLGNIIGFRYSQTYRYIDRLIALGAIQRLPALRDVGQFRPSRFLVL